MSKTSRIALAAPAALIVGSTVGCSYTDVSFDAIRNNPSPEMTRLAYSKKESQQNWTVMADSNLRMVPDDWDRFWYTDHPSMLTPYPTIYTSGNPR